MTKPIPFRYLKNNTTSGGLEAPAYPGDAGFNMFAVGDYDLEPYVPTKILCGINIAVPDGMVAVPLARSSAVNKSIMVWPTLIDSGYRGPIFIFAVNMGDKELHILNGVSIAQLILLPNLAPTVELQEVDVLTRSHRGTNGFGSSGKAI
jgi:dUTP pyrophosphatase